VSMNLLESDDEASLELQTDDVVVEAVGNGEDAARELPPSATPLDAPSPSLELQTDDEVVEAVGNGEDAARELPPSATPLDAPSPSLELQTDDEASELVAAEVEEEAGGGRDMTIDLSSPSAMSAVDEDVFFSPLVATPPTVVVSAAVAVAPAAKVKAGSSRAAAAISPPILNGIAPLASPPATGK